MQFQIPQFIEVEDKIFGPFTFKQFIYLAGGAGLVFLLYKLLPLFIAVIFIVPVGLFSLALAFYKINNKPFVEVLESAIKFGTAGRLYIWRKKPPSPEERKKAEKKEADVFVPHLSESKLKDIAWSLDVEESLYADQDDRS